MSPCLQEKWDAAIRRELDRVRELDQVNGRADDRDEDQVVVEHALLSTFNALLAGLKVQMTHVGEDRDGEPVVEVVLRRSKTPEVRVVEDYDGYGCGNFGACVSADADGVFEAEFFGLDDGKVLRVDDLRNVKALCEALIRRSEQKDNPPICQAMR